mgnify:CR=1 FL=1
MPAAGVGDKMGSLVSRLSKWHPHLHLARFVAWNNLLLVPLSVVAVFTMNWREALRGKTVELPLALGCLGASALAIDQGYGWGYRYLNGYIGCFALLAAYGWLYSAHPLLYRGGFALVAGLSALVQENLRRTIDAVGADDPARCAEQHGRGTGAMFQDDHRKSQTGPRRERIACHSPMFDARAQAPDPSRRTPFPASGAI